MGILKRLVQNLQDADRARDDIDDNQTTDRHLRSLRRQARVQDEEIEKEILKKRIKDYEQRRGEILSRLNDQKKEIFFKKKKEFIEQKKATYGYFSKGNL